MAFHVENQESLLCLGLALQGSLLCEHVLRASLPGVWAKQLQAWSEDSGQAACRQASSGLA